MGSFVPSFAVDGRQNAVVRFEASLQFGHPIPPYVTAEVLVAMQQLRAELDLPAPMTFQLVELQGAPIFPPQFAPSLMGFQRFAPDGEVDASLVCDGQTIAFASGSYPGWGAAKVALTQALGGLAKIIVRHVPVIQSLRLQYLNQFTSATVVPNISELFKPNNRWIPGFSEATSQPWHSHVGVFANQENNTRDLLNVNVDSAVLNQPMSQALFSRVSLLLLGGVFHNVPNEKPYIVTEEDIGNVLDQHLERAHILAKQTLREVIADQYLAAMGDIDRD